MIYALIISLFPWQELQRHTIWPSRSVKHYRLCSQKTCVPTLWLHKQSKQWSFCESCLVASLAKWRSIPLDRHSINISVDSWPRDDQFPQTGHWVLIDTCTYESVDTRSTTCTCINWLSLECQSSVKQDVDWVFYIYIYIYYVIKSIRHHVLV